MHGIRSTNNPSVPQAAVPRAAATAASLPVASISSSVNPRQIEKDAAYARNLQSMYQADPDRIIDVDSETMDERKPAAK
jgi:hypothetical protein